MQNYLENQKIEVDKKEVQLESQMQEKEARAILDKVFEFGDGDVLVGAAKAVAAGVLDNPFAANRAAAGDKHDVEHKSFLYSVGRNLVMLF